MENKLRWASDRTVIGRELQTQISFELNGKRSIVMVMKAVLSMALAGALAWSSGAGEIKIGTLDLQKAMSDYYKWQEAVKEMKGKEAAYLKDLETLRLEGSKLLEEAQDL